MRTDVEARVLVAESLFIIGREVEIQVREVNLDKKCVQGRKKLRMRSERT